MNKKSSCLWQNGENKMNIGVLAVQGAFIEHERCLQQLGVTVSEIRKQEDLWQHTFDGIILPGGESTVMGKLIRDLGLYEPMLMLIKNGLPVFGTCAGLLLLAQQIDGGVGSHFACMDIAVKRNAYGRQLGSFTIQQEMKGLGVIPMVFIRAPYIETVGKKVTVLAEVDGKIVAAREDNMLVTAFHPEVTADLSVHRYFLGMVRNHSL